MSRARLLVIAESFADYVAAMLHGLAAEMDVAVAGPEDLCELLERRVPAEVVLAPLMTSRIRDPRGVQISEQVARIAAGFRPDLVHHQVGGNPWYSLAARRLARSRPLIVTVHEIRPRWRDEDYLWAPISRHLALARAHTVLTASQAVARAFGQRYPGFAHTPIVTLLPEMASLYEPVKAPYEATEPRTVVFFGRIRPYKGVDVLVESARELAASLSDFRLVIAGEGAAASSFFPDGAPHWADLRLGEIADPEVSSVFTGAPIVALPYRSASQSAVAALAIGFGCPLVASDVGGMAEVVHSGRNGLLIRPGDVAALTEALRAILINEDLYRALAAGAARMAHDELSRETAVAQHLEVYRSVCSWRSE